VSRGDGGGGGVGGGGAELDRMRSLSAAEKGTGVTGDRPTGSGTVGRG